MSAEEHHWDRTLKRPTKPTAWHTRQRIAADTARSVLKFPVVGAPILLPGPPVPPPAVDNSLVYLYKQRLVTGINFNYYQPMRRLVSPVPTNPTEGWDDWEDCDLGPSDAEMEYEERRMGDEGRRGQQQESSHVTASRGHSLLDPFAATSTRAAPSTSSTPSPLLAPTLASVPTPPTTKVASASSSLKGTSKGPSPAASSSSASPPLKRASPAGASSTRAPANLSYAKMLVSPSSKGASSVGSTSSGSSKAASPAGVPSTGASSIGATSTGLKAPPKRQSPSTESVPKSKPPVSASASSTSKAPSTSTPQLGKKVRVDEPVTGSDNPNLTNFANFAPVPPRTKAVRPPELVPPPPASKLLGVNKTVREEGVRGYLYQSLGEKEKERLRLYPGDDVYRDGIWHSFPDDARPGKFLFADALPTSIDDETAHLSEWERFLQSSVRPFLSSSSIRHS